MESEVSLPRLEKSATEPEPELQYYLCVHDEYRKRALSSRISYNVDRTPILHSHFSLDYKMLYIGRRWLRTPTVAVANVVLGRERDQAGCSSASIAVVCCIPTP
jgi:hypothetical protein